MSDLRFSRGKRFGKITFSEFEISIYELLKLIRVFREDVTVHVYVCFTVSAYNWAHVTYCTEEVIAGLRQRTILELSELTEELWNKAFQIDVIFSDPAANDYFMSNITCDRLAKPKHMYFFTQCQGEALGLGISASFERQSFNYSIDNGFPDVSSFNQFYGMSGRWKQMSHGHGKTGW